MGIALWAASGLIAFLVARVVARIVPSSHAGWIGELLSALIAASVLGLLATILDFGGWREPDWRAGLFALCGTLALLGLLRTIRLARTHF